MQYQVLLDRLSEFLMVEQGGLELYPVAASRSTNSELKQHYEESGRETAHHREVLTRLIHEIGGDPSYVSPTARVVQFKTSKLLGSSLAVDGLSQPEIEMNDLENVLLAETKDHADWQLLRRMVEQMSDPSMVERLKQTATGLMSAAQSGTTAPLDMDKIRQAIQAAVQEVEPREDDHVNWAREKLTEMSLKMAMMGPAPPPDRGQEILTGPVPPIDQIHPNPVRNGGLLDPTKGPVWQESEIARSMKAGGSGQPAPAARAGRSARSRAR